MKKLSLVIMVLIFAIGSTLAQRTITGTILDDAGEALIGANILVKGTSVGAVTDLDGNYKVEVPEGSNTIVVSYTGYETQELELGASNVLDITMSEGILLTEAVVTALGITREKKTLGYATQQVDGDELTRAKDANFINSLSGKLAGVDIKRNTNLGGSSNVIIRGYTSLQGNNQALFVVNGTPINNDITNTRNMMTGRGGFDYGNAAMDINPEDIESVNVLRGAAATALYGSRAANGVIIITTKKGKKSKGLGVTFSTGYTMGKIDETTMPRYQNQYGAGYGAFYAATGVEGQDNYFDLFDFDGDGIAETVIVPTSEDASFGGFFNPDIMAADWRSLYRELGTYGKTFPYVAAANGPATFYKTANTFNNSIAIDGGGENTNFRISYTNFNAEGILPNSELKRNTFTFSGGFDLNEKWSAQANISFTNTKGKGRYGTGYDGTHNVNQSFRQWYQINADIQDLKNAYDDTGLNITWNPFGAADPARATVPIYFDNPYWVTNENFETDERNRMMGNISLTYKITDWLDIMGRVALDRYSENQQERIAIGSNEVSSYLRFDKEFSEANYDVILNANKYFGEGDIFNFSGLLGMNIRRSNLSSIKNETNGGLVTPGLYSLSNSVAAIVNPQNSSGQFIPWEVEQQIGVNGYFVRAGLGYDNYLYLDLTGRYDVSSTLPKGHNSYFYPSASVSFIFSEFITSNIFSFGKLRVNYAEVGNDAPFGSITNTYDLAPAFNGVPLASSAGTFNNPEKNPDLRPEHTKSYEIGVELNFWKNRLGVDFSWYQGNTFDQILPVSTSSATGSNYKFVNAGEIQNQGMELTLTGTPVRTSDFSWDIAINWAKNTNEVISLFGDQTNLQLSTSQGGISTNATVGEPYGTIWGSDYVYHTNGEPIVYAHSKGGMRYARTTGFDNVLGNINPDWYGGIMNTLSYKDFRFSFLIDIQEGGDFFSLDTWYGFGTGIYDVTAGTNDQGFLVRDDPGAVGVDGGGQPVGGVLAKLDGDGELVLVDGLPVSDGEVNTQYGWVGDYRSTFGWTRAPNKYHIYDASYIKLREIALTYSLPGAWFANNGIGGIDVSLIGRNIWIISKNTEYSDPEAGLSAGNIRGNQSGAYPAVKEYGINFNFRF